MQLKDVKTPADYQAWKLAQRTAPAPAKVAPAKGPATPRPLSPILKRLAELRSRHVLRLTSFRSPPSPNPTTTK